MRSVFATSADGRAWSKPAVLFPVFAQPTSAGERLLGEGNGPWTTLGVTAEAPAGRLYTQSTVLSARHLLWALALLEKPKAVAAITARVALVVCTALGKRRGRRGRRRRRRRRRGRWRRWRLGRHSSATLAVACHAVGAALARAVTSAVARWL